MDSNTISIREWLSYGNLWIGVSNGGLSYLRCDYGIGTPDWRIATRYSKKKANTAISTQNNNTQ